MSFFNDLIKKLKGESTPTRPPMRVFVLDDDQERLDWFARRFPHDELDVATDVKTALEFLNSRNYEVIFLDHDLLPEHYGAEEWDDENSGYAIALAIAEEAQLHRSTTFIVHSLNPEGAERMVTKLHGAGYAIEYIPFPMLAHRLRKRWE